MSKLRDKIQIQDQDSEEVEIDLLELFQYFRSQILILIIALLVGGVGCRGDHALPDHTKVSGNIKVICSISIQ